MLTCINIPIEEFAMPGEKCQRCGSVGSDRRTLSMSCLYDMGELGLPLSRHVVFEADPDAGLELVREPTRIDVPGGRSIAIDRGEGRCDGILRPHALWQAVVCKRCRGEWLAAIRSWFHAEPEGEDHDADERPASAVGAGIFVRDDGAIREIGDDEWYRRNPGREPVRFGGGATP